MPEEVKQVPPTPNEVWVGNGDYLKIVEEMLIALGEEYQLDVWYNGTKLVGNGVTTSPKETN
jgi:hypothetical protein